MGANSAAQPRRPEGGGWIAGEMGQVSAKEFSPVGNQSPGRSGVGGHPVQRCCAGEEPPYMLPGQGAHHPQGRRGTLSPTALRARRLSQTGPPCSPGPSPACPDLADPLPKGSLTGVHRHSPAPAQARHMKSTILKGAGCSVGPRAPQGPHGKAGGIRNAWR